MSSEQIDEYFGKQDYASYGQVICNLPPLINQALAVSREKIEKLASQFSLPITSSTPANSVRGVVAAARAAQGKQPKYTKEDKEEDMRAFDFSSDTGEPTEKQKLGMLDKIYCNPKDQADFGMVPGKDVGFDINPSSDIKKDFDMNSIPVAYRPFVRKLIDDHVSLFSCSD